jgi:hypothetical protein
MKQEPQQQQQQGGMPVEFSRHPFPLYCPVKVFPGTPFTCDEDGVPLPSNARTEVCGVPAHWFVGAAVCCDVHARQCAEAVGIDFDDIIKTMAGLGVPSCDCERLPWEKRPRERIGTDATPNL